MNQIILKNNLLVKTLLLFYKFSNYITDNYRIILIKTRVIFENVKKIKSIPENCIIQCVNIKFMGTHR